jgi:hypothetical protein
VPAQRLKPPPSAKSQKHIRNDSVIKTKHAPQTLKLLLLPRLAYHNLFPTLRINRHSGTRRPL